MAQILLLTKGTGGDLYPFLQLYKGLKARGHQAALMTDLHFEAEVKSHGFEFVPLYTSDQIEGANYPPVDEMRSEESLFELDQILIHLQIGRNLYQYLKEREGSGEIAVVSHDNLKIVGQTIAEILKIPFILVFTAPYFVMLMHMYKEAYRADSDIIHQFRTAFDLPPIQDWESWLKMPRLIIGLWPEWFAPNDPEWLVKVSNVGFVWNQEVEIGEIPEDLKEFLFDGEAPVLITHGTSKPDQSSFVYSSIEACKILGCKALLVTPHDEVVPSSLPRGVRRCKYLPFASILPHMKAVIHHGGIGTLNQAMSAGIPQLVLASGVDRPDNGRRIKRLQVGDYLPPAYWRPDLVAEALRRLMVPEVKERCRQLSIRQLNTIDPTTAACDIIDGSLTRI